MRPMIVATLAFAAVSLAAPAAQAQSVKAEQVWARATAPHAQSAAVYVTLTAGIADRLIGARSEAAATIQVHQTAMDGGIMHMMAVPGGLPLPAGKKITLAPGGYHLMLTGLDDQLVQGETFRLTLYFAHEAPLTINVPVASAGATMAPIGSMRLP